MKKILFSLVLCGMAGMAGAQQVYDANHQLKGYITKDGQVQAKDGTTLASFAIDGRIIDPKGTTLGYMVQGHEMQDKDHKTVGYFLRDCTVQDADHKLIARIDRSGTGAVSNADGKPIGYIDTIEPSRTAAYFFLLKY